MFKHLSRVVQLCLLFLLTMSGPAAWAAGGSWTPGQFAVYVFDVEQGDSQLIVSPTGKTLLIDVREASWNSGKGAAYIAAKLREVMGSDFNHLDYIVPSHLHLDHIGYAGYGGIWGLLETQGYTVGKLVDRDAGVWVDGNGDGLCDPNTEIVWHNAGTLSGTAGNWLCYATNPANAGKLHREIATLGSTSQIDLGGGVIVQVVGVDAIGAVLADGVTPVGGNHTAEATPPSENDYSVGLRIRYGQFDYLTAGDTDGEYAVSSYGYTYNDIEKVIAPRIGQVDMLRANHHGSGHSSNAAYLATLDPTVSLISCGANSYGHPDQATLDRLLATSDVYLTNLCDTTRNYGASVIVNGDIVVQSGDGLTYTVNGRAYLATDPASQDIRALRINEVLPAPSVVYSSEWVELYNPQPWPVDLAGAIIDDIANGGGAPYAIPAGNLVPAYGYWLLNRNNYFNNGGDSVRLLAADGALVDQFDYGNSAYDKSWARMPDGGPWSAIMDATPTPGGPNN